MQEPNFTNLIKAEHLATFELEKFIQFIRTVDPELKPSEAIVLTAIALRQLRERIQDNPEIQNLLKEIAIDIKKV